MSFLHRVLDHFNPRWRVVGCSPVLTVGTIMTGGKVDKTKAYWKLRIFLRESFYRTRRCLAVHAPKGCADQISNFSHYDAAQVWVQTGLWPTGHEFTRFDNGLNGMEAVET